jgi:urate oxidase
MSMLADNRYGKSRVRMVQVKRNKDNHDVREWTVEVLLEGDFESCFIDGDNSKILPTDTMKNAVYSLAQKSSATCMEEFAQELAEFLLTRNPQVTAAHIAIVEKAWDRLLTNGNPHPTAFVQANPELQTTEVSMLRRGEPTVNSGFDGLVMLKTAGSGFVGFLKDSLTTLPEVTDRLFGTSVRARWKYSSPSLTFVRLRGKIREILVSVFANHESKSVQQTLYAMAEAVLNEVLEIEDIELTLPNIHCYLVDLSPFGQVNANEIFVPTDEPRGLIQARLRRPG